MSQLGFIRHRILAGIRDEGGVVPAALKGIRLLLDGGLRGLFLGDAYIPGISYQDWVELHDSLSDSDRDAITNEILRFQHHPLISVLLPVHETPLSMLREAVESVKRQLYKNWELCIADDASSSSELHHYLNEIETDGRVRICRRRQNGHISACSNSALELASGEWVVLLDHDDVLAENALYEIVSVVNHLPQAQMIYSDEDKLDVKGRRARPYFKPDFNLELLRGNNYICHMVAYRRARLLAVGGFREGYEGAQDHDVALRFIEGLQREQIIHIPKILYHWREHRGSTSLGVGVKDYALDAGCRAISEHLERLDIIGSVEANSRGYYRVKYALHDPPPSVGIIVPTRNSLPLLSECLNSIWKLTDYPNYKILVVDNGSTCPETLSWLSTKTSEGMLKVLRDEGPFNFASLNNRAVEQTDTDFVLLLNNDTKVLSENWLRELVTTAQQPDVGAVGAKLLYGDETVQHCGVVVGIGGSAGHAFKGHRRDSPGYYFRAAIRSEFSAVTGACLLVRREVYLSEGGLDEDGLRVAFNDIDFCLRLQSRGYRNIMCPDATLFHFESKSRGYENSPDKAARFSRERALLRQRWLHVIERDSAYNPNLSLDDEQFTHERRFTPDHTGLRPITSGDDEFDCLALLPHEASASLISLLKRVMNPPERAGTMVLLGVGSCGLAEFLVGIRPSWQVCAVESLSDFSAEYLSDSAPRGLPYPIDLVVVLSKSQSIGAKLARDWIARQVALGAIIHQESA